MFCSTFLFHCCWSSVLHVLLRKEATLLMTGFVTPLQRCFFFCLLTLLFHSKVVVAEDSIKHFNEDFPSFQTWDKTPHKECTSFSGCLTMKDRENFLNPNATSIPCGFLAPSDLDLVRSHFKKDTKCKIVLYSVILGAYNYAYNPISSKNFLKDDESICFFLFVDELTLMNGHGILQLAPGQKNTRPQHKSKIVGGDHTWKIILIKNLAASKDKGAAHIAKSIKLSGLELFPNAEWVIFIDTKYIVNSNPTRLIDYVKKNTNHSISTYAHFYDSVRSGFDGAIDRLHFLHSRFNNKMLAAEVQSIKDQQSLYEKEGLFKVYPNSLKGKQIDAAMIIAHNDNRARRFICNWLNEVSMFSRRDQLSFHNVQHHMQIFTYQIWKKEMLGGNNQFMKNLARIKPAHPPKWNMFNDSNPHPFNLHISTTPPRSSLERSN